MDYYTAVKKNEMKLCGQVQENGYDPHIKQQNSKHRTLNTVDSIFKGGYLFQKGINLPM